MRRLQALMPKPTPYPSGKSTRGIRRVLSSRIGMRPRRSRSPSTSEELNTLTRPLGCRSRVIRPAG